MRHLKAYEGDSGIETLLQEMGLLKGLPEDYAQAEALVDQIPVLTICDMLRAVGVDTATTDALTPVPGYREAWLAIQAAAFRKNRSQSESGGASS